MRFGEAPAEVTLTIRALDAADAADARGLLLAAWDDGAPIAALLDRLDAAAAQRSAESLGIAACIEEVLVGLALFGMVAGTEGTAALHGVYVAPEIRKKGVGSALLRGVLRILRDSAARLLIAEVPDTSALEPYRRFLAQQGLAKESEVPDVIADGVALTLWRVELQ